MTKQRRSSWTPVIVSNRGNRTEGDKKVGQAPDSIAAPAFSALHVTYVDGSLEDATKVLDQKSQRRADLRFAIGIALALALPAFIGFGFYIAAEAIILNAS
jgi:hypothetical protein